MVAKEEAEGRRADRGGGGGGGGSRGAHLRMVLELPGLASALDPLVLELSVLADVLAERHRDAVRKKVGESHHEHHLGLWRPRRRTDTATRHT